MSVRMYNPPTTTLTPNSEPQDRNPIFLSIRHKFFNQEIITPDLYFAKSEFPPCVSETKLLVWDFANPSCEKPSAGLE